MTGQAGDKPAGDEAAASAGHRPAVPARARVVIIGGGLAGMATAHALACAGVDDVLVLEREATCGYHASGRNAALGRQLTEDDAVTAFTVRGAAFLRNPPAGFTDTQLWNQTGSVLLVDRAGELEALRARAARWELPHAVIGARELVARWPVLEGVPMAGGVRFDSDGVIDVHALLSGFQRGLRSRGGVVEVGCEVLDIRGADSRSGACTVATTRGEIACDCVVIAAGAWAEELGRRAGGRPARYAPIQRHLFITEAVPDLRSEHARRAPFVWHIGEHEFYVRPERNGYLLSGCDEREVAPCDAVPTPGAREALAEKLAPLAPRLAEIGIARGWACLRTFAPDRRPVIGWDAGAPALFWVAGLGGHGATGSAAVGQRAAELLLERLG